MLANGYSHRRVKTALVISMYHIMPPEHLGHAAVTLCRHTDILEDGTLRDNGNRNYEFVVRTIATVGNYGESGVQDGIPALAFCCKYCILYNILIQQYTNIIYSIADAIKILLHHC